MVKGSVEDELTTLRRRRKLNYRYRRAAVWIAEEGLPFFICHCYKPHNLDVFDQTFGRPEEARYPFRDALWQRLVQLHSLLLETLLG